MPWHAHEETLMTATDKMLARKEGRVGTMIFNNPERHNAVSLEMWEAATRILEDFARDDEVRVVVVTGAGGKAFVSGADISKFESERASQEAVAHYNATSGAFYATLYDFPKPTLAQIQGYCIGGGLALAIACDLRFCTEGARFALPAAKLGLGYGLKRHRHRPSHTSASSSPRSRSAPPRLGPCASSSRCCPRPSLRASSPTMPTPSRRTRR
jgi:enoyl-CoA hydratase/carnithine racemase